MKRIIQTTLLILLTGILLWSCSQTTRYKVLSVFFDGVTPPDSGQAAEVEGEKANAARTAGNTTRSEPQYYYHAIYKQKECGACHDSENANRLVQEIPDLCYQCHTDFSEEFEYVHVPVAMGECTECHQPHLARHDHLLLAGVQELCFSCHAEEDLRESETHSGVGETACTECHNPHGGEDEYMFN